MNTIEEIRKLRESGLTLEQAKETLLGKENTQAMQEELAEAIKKLAVKQVIVIRKDLKMRRGKEIAQGSHASIAFLTRKIQRYLNDVKYEEKHFAEYISPIELDWINGIFAKVCVRVNSEEELLEIERKAKEAGLECHLITDRGLTEFGGVPTHTCLAVGPDESEKIDAITGHLELY